MVPGCAWPGAPDAGDDPRWPAPPARPRCAAWSGPWPPLAADILQGLIDAVTFTSPSTVYGFVDMVGAEVARSGQFAAAVIGPVTAQAARDAGMRDLVMAARSSAEGLAEALARRFA